MPNSSLSRNFSQCNHLRLADRWNEYCARRRPLRTVSLWTRSRVVVLCSRALRLTLSPSIVTRTLSLSLSSHSFSCWDDKQNRNQLAWAHKRRGYNWEYYLLARALAEQVLGYFIRRSHRVGTGNSYRRCSLIRLLNVADGRDAFCGSFLVFLLLLCHFLLFVAFACVVCVWIANFGKFPLTFLLLSQINKIYFLLIHNKNI